MSNATDIAEKSLKKTLFDENTTHQSLIANTEQALREIESIDISSCKNVFQAKFRKLMNLIREMIIFLKKVESVGELSKVDKFEYSKQFDRNANELSRLWKEIKQMDN